MAEILESVSIPSVISREECVYCYQSLYNDISVENTLNICLHCFQAVCHRHLRLHFKVALNVTHSSHSIYLNLAKVRRPEDRDKSNIRNKKIKLRVEEKSEDQIYETCWSLAKLDETTCSLQFLCTSKDVNLAGPIISKVDQILNAKSQEMVDRTSSWELTVKPCTHVENFQPPKLVFSRQTGTVCADCGLSENLWLCLHCGNIGCGRNQVGVKGHSHALKHYKITPGHLLAVKLGSLSKHSSDLYCYSCDDDTKFEDLNPFMEALKCFGINMENKLASEKTLVELQVEQNMNWDFQMTDSEGKDLIKLEPNKDRGCGLINLGNSCYLNSILQCLFNGGVRDWSLMGLGIDFPQDVLFPANNLSCQLIKLNNAMKIEPEKYLQGIRPKSFKKCIGQSNEEFRSERQQDAMEFLGFLVDILDKKIFQKGLNPNDLMRFAMEDKLQCTQCSRVRYTVEAAQSLQLPMPENEDPQDLVHIISQYFRGEEVEFTCPHCKKPVKAIKKPALNSYPSTLVINPVRIRAVNWVPTKTNNELNLPGLENPDETLDISQFGSNRFNARKDELMFEEDKQNAEFVPNPTSVSQLLEMGFQHNAINRALFATGNVNTEFAMNWLFQHMEDSDLNESFTPRTSGPGEKFQVNPELLANMVSMGLSEKLSAKALFLNNGDINRSVEWVLTNTDDDGEIQHDTLSNDPKDYGYKTPNPYMLTGVVCHKGNSPHSGHYVAFIRQSVNNEKKWVLYNDEKMVVAVLDNFEEIKKNGYIYLYSRM